MDAIAAATTAKRKKRSRKIPEALIYEIVDGRPVYFKGYRDVLNGKLKIEEIIPESSLQAWLKTQLSSMLLFMLRDKGYEVIAGELGLILQQGGRRGVDICIYQADKFRLSRHFLKTAPEVVIEIDIQADLEDENEMDYVIKKIDDYLQFGVKKVIWIFTSNKVIMTATAQKPWLTLGWDAMIETIEGVTFNLEKMLGGRPID